MNKFTIKACPICQSAQFERMFSCKDHYASGESFEVFCCGNCGFRFTQNFPDETEIGRYYETPDYISHSDTKKGLMNGIYHKARNYMLLKKARLITTELGRDTGRLLDIGTGTGYFSNTMKNRGWEVTAIEKNAQARKFAFDHFGLEVQAETSFESLPAASFDAVTLWHVMEHLEQLNETWEQINLLLKDDGILVIAVPNSNSWDAAKYLEEWAAYDVPRHLWHFTPDTMKRIAEKHHFRLVRHYPMPFDAFYVAILSEKYKNNPLAFIKGMTNGLKAWIASRGKPELSSSVIYVFKKANYGKK